MQRPQAAVIDAVVGQHQALQAGLQAGRQAVHEVVGGVQHTGAGHLGHLLRQLLHRMSAQESWASRDERPCVEEQPASLPRTFRRAARSPMTPVACQLASLSPFL